MSNQPAVIRGLAYTVSDARRHLLVQGLWETYKQFPMNAEIPRANLAAPGPETFAASKLALALVEEECVKEKDTSYIGALQRYIAHPTLENAVALADGGIDTIYVIMQAFYQLDLPFEELFCAVHANNMQKLMRDEQGKLLKREDGKLLKPVNHPAPDLIGVLMRHLDSKADKEN